MRLAEGLSNPPSLLAFSHDGLSLGVSYERSVGVYSCVDAPEVQEDALAVDVSGPSQVRYSEHFNGKVEVDSVAPVVGLRLVVDDDLYWQGIHEEYGDISYYPPNPGTYELIAEAFDGRNTGRGTFGVTVLAE